MHWFLRGTAAVLIGFAATIVVNVLMVRTLPLSVFGNPVLQVSLRIAVLVLAVVIYGLLTVWYSPVYVEHRRLKAGLCVKCGYDLQGNVSGICPECGARR